MTTPLRARILAPCGQAYCGHGCWDCRARARLLTPCLTFQLVELREWRRIDEALDDVREAALHAVYALGDYATRKEA